MPDDDDNLSTVHADLVGRFEHDKRIRYLEVEQGVQSATLAEVKATLPRMEDRLVKAIEASKPASPWPAVGALAGVMAVLVVVFAAIYGQ
ncbi:MAG: hypothetical protein L0K86_16865, partial [Actinomycetia bacterium]|nr:hypothetical protein [Actinomycetes bacterium]